jgi:hypothetical protein
VSGEQVNGFGQSASRGFVALARCPAVLGANVGRASTYGGVRPDGQPDRSRGRCHIGTRLESTGVRYPSGRHVITLGTYLLANPSGVLAPPVKLGCLPDRDRACFGPACSWHCVAAPGDLAGGEEMTSLAALIIIVLHAR